MYIRDFNGELALKTLERGEHTDVFVKKKNMPTKPRYILYCIAPHLGSFRSRLWGADNETTLPATCCGLFFSLGCFSSAVRERYRTSQCRFWVLLCCLWLYSVYTLHIRYN